MQPESENCDVMNRTTKEKVRELVKKRVPRELLRLLPHNSYCLPSLHLRSREHTAAALHALSGLQGAWGDLVNLREVSKGLLPLFEPLEG